MTIPYQPLPPLGRPDLSRQRPTNLKEFLFGACYYPEHWTEAERADDPERMARAGINVVRMAEFAWDRLEPCEGVFDFSFFDEQIERLASHGIRTILCTPTAAPPRWLTRQQPQMLRVDASGRKMQHGSRQHCCHSSPDFRQHSRRITAALAEHFRNNPAVIGWQTDNEFLCHFSQCYCPSCATAFGDYLHWRFEGDIDRLNADWGTVFWAQTYESFRDIPLPREQTPAYENPSHRLAYKLFLSDAVARFQHEQIELLRAANADWFIMHNGVFWSLDYRGAFTRDLDFLGYDSYPFFQNDPRLRPASHAMALERVRSLSGNFIVPELQSGPGGQRPYFHSNPEPGELRRISHACVAHGADSLLYFRWRTCRFGAEEYWCGILDHDNRPRRRYDEVAHTGRELQTIAPYLLGTSVRSEVAIAGVDLTVNEAHESYTLGLPSHVNVGDDLFRWFHEHGYAAGYAHPEDTLDGLQLYLIPHWAYFDPAWLPNLERFIRQGGTLVIGARTATRDPRNQVVAQTIPGCLATLCGITVEEYGRLNPSPGARDYRLRFAPTVDQSCGDSENEHAAELWYERLAPLAPLAANGPAGGQRNEESPSVVAHWTTRHLTGEPAITKRRIGQGEVWYVGTYLTGALMQTLLPRLCAASGLQPAHPCWQAGLEIVVREKANERLWFLLNHSDAPMQVVQPPHGTELLTGLVATNVLHLPSNGVAVIHQA